MSNFWANRLTPQAPTAPAAPAPSNQPWWAPKQAPAPVQQQPQQPAPMPQAQPQQGSVSPAGEETLSEMLQQTEYHSDQAQSAKDTETCPNCGSRNYMRASGHPNSMKQCFECGNNPRFEQMAAGTAGIPTKGPVRAARVQNVPTGYPAMGSIVGHA